MVTRADQYYDGCSYRSSPAPHQYTLQAGWQKFLGRYFACPPEEERFPGQSQNAGRHFEEAMNSQVNRALWVAPATGISYLVDKT